MDRQVAIKVLPRSLASNQEFTGRFLREARAAGRLSHPNIVAGIDAGFADGYYYLAMEYVEGKDLGNRIEESGALDEDEVLDIGRQIALALDHAHAAGIFHRDVKPDNILVTRDGQAKLCDLGLARSNDDDMRVTQAGVAIGTPFYISPEQVRGKPPDARADIYSLGCTLYHMICGFVPFDGENAMQVMQKHLNEQAAPIRDVRPDVSSALGAIIARMMAKDPEDRYEVASDLAEDLSKAAEGGVPAALTASMSDRRRTTDRRRSTRSTRAVKPVSRKLRAVESDADEGQELLYPDPLEGHRLPVGLIIVIVGIIVMLAAGIATLVIIRQRDAQRQETRPAPLRPSPRH
jgi:eukaryotic-like serine/threonine-protein kinase